jgi:NadR type nicotinamide-nucleotide adenylyltransferase
VFTSEEYGDRFASHLGAEHVSVDPDRVTHPVSGTLVRADRAAQWHQLEACVRAGLVRRVCVLGAESTGTSTLAEALADHYETVCVPEYGREFCEDRMRRGMTLDWRSDHFVEIASRQQAIEDQAARECDPVLICDTDALATSIWHERYLDERSPVVEALAAGRTYALYVLTSDDIPFVQDGTRDGEHVRGWMTQRFRDVLAARSEPWIEVTGRHEDRLRAAIRAIDEICCPASIEAV